MRTLGISLLVVVAAVSIIAARPSPKPAVLPGTIPEIDASRYPSLQAALDALPPPKASAGASFEASIHGSTWGGSMIKRGFIGRGMHLQLGHPKYRRQGHHLGDQRDSRAGETRFGG